MDEPRLYTVITQLHHRLIIQVCYNNTHTPKTRPRGSGRGVKRRFEVKQVALLNESGGDKKQGDTKDMSGHESEVQEKGSKKKKKVSRQMQSTVQLSLPRN